MFHARPAGNILPLKLRDLSQRKANGQLYITKVLAASIRHPRHIVEAAPTGADGATCPYKVIKQSIAHPLTDAGPEKFLAHWQRAQAPPENGRVRAAVTA
ncbi:MAG: hypothetical protein HY023_12070 [Chloroflexi bacterium]|nr:hypothetical protein [Chloroflexota bacterium]